MTMRKSALAAGPVFVTGVVTLLEQLGLPGHVGSPPPVTFAVFTTVLAAFAVGVTAMVNVAVAFGASPKGIVHVTC